MYPETLLGLAILNITLPIYFVGKNDSAIFSVEGMQKPDISISFGDGYSYDSRENPSVFQFLELSGAITEITVNHQFNVMGIFDVTVNATDGVTSLQHSSTATVVEEIDGIELVLLSPSLVALFDNITVKATVKNGSDLVFDWEFGDFSGGQYTSVESSNQTSIANHSYGVADIYHVSVMVSNSYQDPIEVFLNQTIQAVELIEQLHLQMIPPRLAVPLIEGSLGSMTRPVVFEARLWRGSDVEFHFNFGDGTAEKVAIVHHVWPHGVVRHSFTSAGVYNISVTAFNRLSSVTKYLERPLVVQLPPKGLTLDQPYYIIHRNSTLHARVSVTSGTNVSYHWMVAGKQVEVLGEELVMAFPEVEAYIVTVEASNLVTDEAFEGIQKPSASARIYVQQMLKNVVLCIVSTISESTCGEETLALPLDEEVTYEAKVIPASELALRFTWNVGLGELRQTSHSLFKVKYRKPGRYFVNVTVQNHISSTSSPILKLHLIQKLCNLTAIHIKGQNLVNHSVSYSVFYWFGTDVTFKWNFGDGSETLITTSSEVQHIYHRVGEYIVSVHAWNKFSKANISTNTFILDQMCQKPELSFPDQNINMIVYSTEDILFEPQIIIACESNLADYQWVIKDKSNGSVAEIKDSNRLLKQELLLPAHSIPVGEYVVELRVSMPHTIVHNSIMTMLHVVLPKPGFRLQGGVMRSISHLETVRIALTHDTNQDIRNFNFHWHCSSLVAKHVPCFAEEVPPPFLGNPVSEFLLPISILDERIKTAVIDVSVEDPDILSASQVFDISDEFNPLMISVDCLGCNDNTVAEGQRLIFVANCENCASEDEVQYTWELWIVQEGKTSFFFGSQECVQADGSTFYIMASNSTEDTLNVTHSSTANKTLYLSASQADFEDLPPFPSLPGLNDELKLNVKRKRRQTSPQWFDVPDDHRYPHILDNLIVEGETFFEDNFTLPEEFMDDDLNSLEDPQHPPYGPHFPITEEGAPGESGSAAARDQGQQVFGRAFPNSIEEGHIFEGPTNGRKDLPGVLTDSDEVSENELPGDPIRDNRIDPATPHLVQQPKVPLMIGPNDTTTGLSSKFLVLKRHVLRAGHSYMVQVAANSKGERADGFAMDYVKVQVGPINGKCTLMPLSGYSVDQVYRLHCLEWKSENLPLYYELSYSLEPDGFKQLVYFGLNQNVKFVLPQGYAKNNYSVYLTVTVWDRQGSATKVCSIIRQVMPKHIGLPIEHYIYNETFHRKSILNKMLKEKQDHAALQKMKVLVDTLNLRSDQPPDIETYADVLKIRKELRWHFLKTAESLTLYSKAEAVQLISTLGGIILFHDELDGVHLNLFVEIFSKFLKRKWEFGGAYPFENLEENIISALSNLAMTADHMIAEGKSEMLEVLYFAKNSLSSQIKDILKRKLISESPVQVERSSLSLTAAYIVADNVRFAISTKHAKVLFSNRIISLSVTVNKTIRPQDSVLHTITSPCLAVVTEEYALLSEEKFPHAISSIQSYSVSFRLFSCDDFESIHVETLPEHMENSIQFTNFNGTDDKDVHFLASANINIHSINVTKENSERSLHFHVEVVGNETKESVPLIVLFSFQELPDLRNHVLKFYFDGKRKDLHVNIPTEILQAAGTYYLSLMGAGLYEDHSYQEDFEKIEYKLSAVTHSCIQKTNGLWTYHGCATAFEHNSHDIICRCNSLVGVSVVSAQVTTELLVVPYSELIDPYANPLVITFLLFIIVCYVLLLIPNYYGDRNRRVYLEPIPMMDFKATLPQKYLVTVSTGFCRSAGTTSSVYMVLHGLEDITETKHLIGGEGISCFHRGSDVSFFLSAKHSLGQLQKIEIWHNNSGSSPSWYLIKVIVEDLNTGSKYLFPCDNWLSASKGDFHVERELIVSSHQSTFLETMKEYALKCLYYVTIWNSLTFNVPTSTFSAIQRLTCCLCFFLGTSALLSVLLGQLFPEDIVHPYFSSQMALLSLCTAAFLSVIQLFPALLFSCSQQVEWDIFSAVSRTFKSISLKNIYCCLQGKYSFRSSSLSNSSYLSYSDTDSMFSSYSSSAASSSEVLEDDSCLAKERLSVRSSSVSLRQSSFQVTNFDKTMITWQAIENWAKLKPNVSSDDSNESGRGSLQSYVESFTKRALDKYAFGSLSASLNRVDEEKSNETIPFNFGNFRRPLPVFFYYLGWTFLMFQLLLSFYFNMSHTIRMNHHQSLQWMKAVLACMLFSSFIIFPLFSFVCALVLSASSRCRHASKTLKNSTLNSDASDVNCEKYIDKKWLYFMNYLRPPTESSLILSWIQSSKQKSIYSAVCESCRSIFLAVLLLLMIFGFNNDLRSDYHQKLSIEKAFFRPPLHSVNSVWSWLSIEMLDTYYGSQQCLNQMHNCGSIAHTGCYPIGDMVVEKYDKTALDCEEHLKYHPLHHCSRRKHSKEHLKRKKDILPWKTIGIFAETVDKLMLNSSRSDAFSQIMDLKGDKWITQETTALRVMMTLFNPTFSSMWSVILTLKSSGNNQFIMSAIILPLRLQQWSSFLNIIHLLLEMIFVIITAAMVKKISWRIWKSGLLFWKIPRNVFEVFFAAMSLVYVFLSAWYLIEMHGVSNNLKDHLYDWSHILSAAQLQTLSRNTLGLVLFLHMLRSVRILKLDPQTFLFLQVLRCSWKLLFTLGVILLMFAFGSRVFTMFLPNHHHFRHLDQNPLVQSIKILNFLLKPFSLPEVTNVLTSINVILLMMFFLALVAFNLVSVALVRSVLISSKALSRQDERKKATFPEILKIVQAKVVQSFKPIQGISVCKEESRLPIELLLQELEVLAEQLLDKANALFKESDDNVENRNSIFVNRTQEVEEAVACNREGMYSSATVAEDMINISLLEQNPEELKDHHHSTPLDNIALKPLKQKINHCLHSEPPTSSSSDTHLMAVCKTSSMYRSHSDISLDSTKTKELSHNHLGLRKTKSFGKNRGKKIADLKDMII